MSPPSANSDKSDDETGEGGPSGSASTQGIKRSSRACDRCRKSKSKCEPAPSGEDQCKSCLASGAVCTFSGPSFRRGPPKGYIQALEHRLHQMESVLAAVMSSKDVRAKGIIADLRRDTLAKHILDGVDSGPFGPSGRLQRSVDPTQDNFFASIVSAAPPKQINNRSRRQSRMTRESVTQHDPAVLVRPTLQWQDRLSESLARWSEQGPQASFARPAPASAHIPTSGSRAQPGTSAEPARRKRRLNAPPAAGPNPRWDELHVMEDTDKDELDDTADAFGNLSIDENKEVRYHGNSCGLVWLAKDNRWDKRNLGGIWNFPMAQIWPGGPHASTNTEKARVEAHIALPPPDVQDHLVARYFTYVNPVFPVIEKEAFMQEFHSQKYGYPEPSTARVDPASQVVRPERMQKVSKLLLFSMFTFAEQYGDEAAAAQYATSARKVLDTMYQESQTSTCQALILLGVREFGIGSLEEGWLHVGMAVRMALDLGLNRNSEKWQHNGRELFTPAERSIRRRIWWACCLADKYSAQFLGRPMAVHEGDFSTLLPDLSEDDAEELWVPIHADPLGHSILPMPARLMSYFRAAGSLSVIHGEVVEKIYPVTRVSPIPRRALMEQIHSRLIQWSINLPEALQYSSTSKRPVPPPHVLTLHVQYWAIMLLLHRPFVPKQFDSSAAAKSSVDTDPVPWKSFDICQGAASHISAFATLYHRKFDLRWGSPFLATGLQSAGIMHIITLKQGSLNPQARQGLHDCIAACDHMREVWASAARVGDLLRGASVQLDTVARALPGPSRKRPAEAAPDHESISIRMEPQRLQPALPPMPRQEDGLPRPEPIAPLGTYHTQEEDQHDLHSGSLLADLLGPELSTLEAPPAVAPGYDWWPILPASENMAMPEAPQEGYHSYTVMPSQSFTFNQQNLSPDFLQGIRDPILHFPSAFHTR